MSVERNVDPGQSPADLAGSDLARSAGLTSTGLTSTGITSTNLTSAGHTSTGFTPTNLTTPAVRPANVKKGGLTSADLGAANLAAANLVAPHDDLDTNGRHGTTMPRLIAVNDLPSSHPDAEADDPADNQADDQADEADEADVADDDVDDASRRGTADAWDLVRRTQDGDSEAFGLLYDRYVDTVYRFVYYRLGDRTQAEDLTSETFLRALRRISTVHEQGRDIGAWLVTIARNLVLDHVKSAQYRLCVPTEEIVEAHLEQAGDTTEAAALAGLDQRALLEAVRLLSPEQQESIVLRFFQGLSLAETAEVMGRNAGAVKALQHRAMQRLHVLLSSPPPKPATTVADETVRRELPRRHSPRAPPVTEDLTATRRRYRTRSRRNH